jgi:hypothetical protein
VILQRDAADVLHVADDESGLRTPPAV